MSNRKEDTPSRIVRRAYEQKHKDERKQKNTVWGTSIDREYAEEINAFLNQYGLTKVRLIVEGYKTLKAQYTPNKIE